MHKRFIVNSTDTYVSSPDQWPMQQMRICAASNASFRPCGKLRCMATPKTVPGSHIPDNISGRLMGGNNAKSLYQKIVDAPFADKLLMGKLGLGIVVLLKMNDANKTLDRIALSKTELAKGAQEVSVVPFHEIRIPYGSQNAILNSIETQSYKLIDDWACMFSPVLTPEEARLNQVGAGIMCSLIWPLPSGHGALIYSFFIHGEDIGSAQIEFAEAYAKLVDKTLDGQAN